LPVNISHFQQLGAGSSIPSIRKNELAEFKINLLPLDTQLKVVKLQKLHQKEIELHSNLIIKKNELYQKIISNIVNH
jgi:restriction endonuclease S subunit